MLPSLVICKQSKLGAASFAQFNQKKFRLKQGQIAEPAFVLFFLFSIVLRACVFKGVFTRFLDHTFCPEHIVHGARVSTSKWEVIKTLGSTLAWENNR